MASFIGRRKFLATLGSAAVAWPFAARAQAYPSRPITIVAPYPAGGPMDALARILAELMRTSLGQPVIIENVSGAGGSIGVGRVARAAPDGYTVSIGHWGTHVLNGAGYQLQYDVVKDFEPVSLLADTPQWILARKTFPANNLKEFIEWLKQNPDKATAGRVGPGGEVAGIYFQKKTGTSFPFVPYRGAAPLYQDMLVGQIDFNFGPAASTFVHVRNGNLKAYAVMAKTRWAATPDVPTIDEAGVSGLYASYWHGLWLPKGTPQEVIVKLNAAVQAALADATVRNRFANQGYDIPSPEQQTPEVLAAQQKAEIEKWWPILKAETKGGKEMVDVLIMAALLLIMLLAAAFLINYFFPAAFPVSFPAFWRQADVPNQGVIKRDWVATGRIDFATQSTTNPKGNDQPAEFKLLVEERRIVESIAGNEHLEIQWRLATLREAKSVVTQYHKYLSDNSLIQTVFDETPSLPPPVTTQGNPSD